MFSFSPGNFMKIIESKKDELIDNTVESFVAYINDQPFVSSCKKNGLSLDIKYKSELYDIPGNIAAILTSGGIVNGKLKEKPIIVKGFNK